MRFSYRLLHIPSALILIAFFVAGCLGAPGAREASPSSGNPGGAAQATTASAAADPTEPLATLTPTAVLPTPTSTPVPTATPVPAQLVQLMQGGCCANPAWLPDSAGVLFIDKPRADLPVGMYRVNVDAPNQSELWSERIAFYTRELDFAQIPEPAGTRLIRVSDGQEFRIPNRGRQVQLSPDRTRVVWAETRETFPIENRVTNIMLANLDGSGATRITQVLRGGVSGWLDDQRLLLSGRASRETYDTTVFVYNLADGSQTELVKAERLRLTAPSRDGSWLACAITNDAAPARNGIWVVRTDGTDAHKLEVYGAAQWRDDTHLILVPLEMGAPSHAFWEYDVESGTMQRLTPPDPPFKIASGDWAVSPDGTKIVFVNAADNNLWLWKLPPNPLP